MPLRLAIIGTGFIAQYHVRPDADPAQSLFPDGEAEFVAVVDVVEERARAFAEKYGIARYYTDADEMLAREKPDIVNVATPPALHASMAIKAMEAGAWVMCEKPLCSSLRELDAIADAEARTGNWCSSVFQFRFGSAARHLRRIIQDQVVGKLLVGTCHTTWFRDAEYYAVDWRGTWASELGGPTMGHGIHAMDSFLWQMGDWTEVRAMCATIDRGVEVEDTSSATVRFASGAMGNILNSVLCPHQSTYVRYDFQRGSAWTEGALYDLNNERWRFETLESVDDKTRERFQTIVDDLPCTHVVQLRELVADRLIGRQPLVSGPEARRTLEFITALYKSAYTGEKVERASIVPGDPFYESVGGSWAEAAKKGSSS